MRNWGSGRIGAKAAQREAGRRNGQKSLCQLDQSV